MTIYAEIPMWLGLYSGDPRVDGTALPLPRAFVETWEVVRRETFVNTDTLRFHIRASVPAVTHVSLFDSLTSWPPGPNFVYEVQPAFLPVVGRDLAVRPGCLTIGYAFPGSRRAYGRWAFGISQYGRWPATGLTIKIVHFALDTLFEAKPLFCGGTWPVVVGDNQSHAP